MSRQLARVVRIDDVRPIPGADTIEVALIGGWSVIVRKNEFSRGDLGVYFEIDSFLPAGHPSWDFLLERKSTEFEGARGHVLRSVRMRGQVSQGLLLHRSVLNGLAQVDSLAPGTDVSELLGVLKYEPPIPAELAGLARGLFPARVPKTDQERIQNLALQLDAWQQEGARGELTWEVTEKLEGASCTYAMLEGELHVCSRNIDLLETEGNTLWLQARELDIENKLRATFGDRNIALQGELIGNGIQDNLYRLNGHQFHLYDVYDVATGQYYRADERQSLAKDFAIRHVPVLDTAFVIDGNVSMETLLADADGESVLRKGQLREGKVYKARQKPVSFKVISNQYLIAHKK